MAARKSYARRDDTGDGSPVRGRLTVAGIVAIATDTILNGGGMWSVVLNLDESDSYTMFEQGLSLGPKLTDAAASAAGSGEMRMLPALAIALALGFVLSLAPHKLWKSAEGHEQQTRRRIAAVFAALGGYYTTYLLISAVGVPGLWAYGVAGVIEWLLFEFKREVLR